MKSQVNFLRLVYPPISNQEAEWVKDDLNVREVMNKSHLYMICQRAEAFFHFPSDEKLLSNILRAKGHVPFLIVCDATTAFGAFDLEKMLLNDDLFSEGLYDITVEMGEKIFRLWQVSPETGEKIDVINWFTPDKVIFDKSNDHPAICGVDNYRDFSRYFLHYVGISKEDDSLQRLIIKPHDKRLRVLSYEQPILEQSRVTDEIILLFFDIEPLRIGIVESEAEFDSLYEESICPTVINPIPIFADAEKAFVKVLDTKYNTLKYKSYPKGKDGLFGTGLNRYGYVIDEDITLFTEQDEIRGGRTKIQKGNAYPKNVDLILIEGEEVNLIKFDEMDILGNE